MKVSGPRNRVQTQVSPRMSLSKGASSPLTRVVIYIPPCSRKDSGGKHQESHCPESVPMAASYLVRLALKKFLQADCLELLLWPCPVSGHLAVVGTRVKEPGRILRL